MGLLFNHIELTFKTKFIHVYAGAPLAWRTRLGRLRPAKNGGGCHHRVLFCKIKRSYQSYPLWRPWYVFVFHTHFECEKQQQILTQINLALPFDMRVRNYKEQILEKNQLAVIFLSNLGWWHKKITRKIVIWVIRE